MTEISLLPAARAELRRAVARFDADASGAGDRLVDEVEQALRRIADFPEHGSPYLHGTRRVILPRMPFSIVYRVTPGSVLIVALAHHRRRPGYWLGRLR
jgi:plasmid stabilization system protein ParE